MRAVTLHDGHCGISECESPAPASDEVLIKTAYAGINRADLLQKQGKYPLPQKTPCIPGMELSGEIIACGTEVSGWKTGDRVCALVSEGAFAEYVAVPASHLLPVAEHISLEAAAALPEACFTSWISLVWQARIAAHETLLIHGGTSGIGSIAVQIACILGARVFTTSGTDEKCTLCETLGAEKAINYRKDDFVARVKTLTKNNGVDIILDMVGGDYFGRNLECLSQDGRLCIIAFQKGAKAEVNLAPVLLKHLSVMGSTLRSRPSHEKAQIAAELKQNIWDFVEKGAIKPVIDHVFPLAQAEKALLRMEEGLNVGKILLKI